MIPQIKLNEKTNKTQNEGKQNLLSVQLFMFLEKLFLSVSGLRTFFWFCFGWHANVLLDFCFRTKFDWSSIKPGLELGSDHRSFEPI